MFDETGRKEYGTNLVHLIKDLRKEFKAPEMRVVVGVMVVNGPRNEVNPKQKDVRDGHPAFWRDGTLPDSNTRQEFPAGPQLPLVE